MYRSFLVRVWIEKDEKKAAGWQAEVQEIQSGERWNFSSREALRTFLQWLIADYERDRRDQE